MLTRPYRPIAILGLVLLAVFPAGDARRGQPAAAGASPADAAWYALRPAAGWHLAGRVAVQPAPNGDFRFTVSVVGPDEEIIRKLGWQVMALTCDELASPARYLKPKRYVPGTTIERSRMLYRTEDRFILDSDRRSFTIIASPDWMIEPFSVSASFNSPDGKAELATCADLPPLP